MKNPLPLPLLVSALVLLLQTSPLLAYSRIDCTFESGNCGYTQSSGNSWMRTNNASINPGHDHTTGSGYWLSSIPSSNYSGTQEFFVFSPYLYSTSQPSCLRFWYVFFGLEKAQFDVKINHQSNTFNTQTLWTKLTPQSNSWIQGYVDIPKQPSYFYVIWHAILTSKFHDTVGVDDITVTPGPCPPSPLVDFESGMGSWTNQGASLANGTPINDHTAQTSLGHYLLNKGGSTTSVISASMKNLTSTYTNNFYSYCFKLWYYFLFQPNTGDTTSYIFLNLTNYRYKYSKMLTVQDAYNDGLYNKWEPLYFSIPNPKRMAPYQVPNKDPQMTITLYGKGATQVAIDDLLLSDNACETSGDCDFEKDFCGWSNVGRYLWLRSTGGNTKALTKSPPVDTTTKTAAGWYAVFPLEYIKAYDSAMIQSPPLSNRYSYNCFSFNYWAVTTTEVYKVAAFYVNFYDLTKFNQPIARVAVNASTFPMWQRFHFSMPKLPLRYSISISTAFSTGRIVSDLAIDDIALSDSSCRGDRPAVVSSTPIPYNERIWDCTFEYQCRQWSFDNNWKMTSFRKLPPSLPAPRSDHNRKTPEGGYLLYLPPSSSQNMTTTTSFLNSTVITDKQHCLSFWYYDSSEIFFSLTVYLNTKTHSIILRTVRPNIASRSWKMVKADIWPYYSSQYISLKLVTTTGVANGSFAIDDIKLVPGECKHVDDFVYTFDSLDNLEIVRVSPLNGFMGTIHYQGQRTYPSAPTRDHTTGTGGYFLFMNRQTDFNTTYTDQLIVDNLPAMRFNPELDNIRCFRFAYQVKGDASLKVYLSQVNSNSYYYPIFSTYADHTNWIVAQVPYSAYYEHKLVFIMTKQWDANSYVAIDDLSVSSHNCKRAVECDFDDDVCAYSSSLYKSAYDFTRYVGPPSNANWPGPAYDHTKRGYGGGYLTMTGFPSTQDRTRTSVVQSPIEIFPYSISTNYCLSFFATLTESDASLSITLNVFGRTASGTSTSNVVNVATINNKTKNQWQWFGVDIDRKTFIGYHEFNMVFGAQTSKANTVVAIDDIKLARTSCDYGYRFHCADGTVIDADKLCNFKYDCPGKDHSDEANCGECDFESGTSCGWQTEYKYGEYSSQGRWYLAKASSGYIGPKVDGNGNANGHYLYLSNYLAKLFVAGTKLTRNYGDYKIQFKDAYFTCSMTFDYYIYSNRTQYSAATLEVNAGSDADSAVLKAYYSTYFFTKTNSWQKGIVYLGGFPGSFVVTFLGSRFTVNESVALDNIQFHNCSFPNPIGPKATCPASAEVMCGDSRICIDPSDLCDFEDDCGTNWDERWSLCSPAANPKVPPACAFEQSLEFCGITMETSEKLFNWQLTRSYDYNVIGYSGPGADHTTKDRSGQFLMLKSYNKKYLNKNIRLYSPFMYSKGGACWLRFFYYNNGNESLSSYNSLKVWVQYADGSNDDSGTLFRSNSYMAYWRKGKVKYSSGSAFRFVFDSQLADNRGSISLDDVSYSSNCVYSPNSKLTPGSHSHAAVTVILVLLALAIVGGVGFFLYRKHKSGELTTYVDRVSSMMPGKKSSQMSHVVNVNYKDGPSTSAAE